MRPASRSIPLAATALAAMLGACGGEPRQAGADTPAPAASALQSQRTYACAASIAPDQAAADAEVRRSYAEWKKHHLTPRGAGGHLRVMSRSVRDADRPTYSEGIAYGMLLAAYLGDRPTLDRLWAYARSHHNARGLMVWQVSARGEHFDETAATDADQDMAFALLVADDRWGGYRQDALGLMRRILEHAIEPGSFVVRPGDTWGGAEVTNPSYFAPAYYRRFAAHSGDARWLRVLERSYAVLARINAHGGPRALLLPNWSTAAGTPPTGEFADRDYEYGYDATRAPWRLAMDAAWDCERRAQGQLQRMNAFFQRVRPSRMGDLYTLDGERKGGAHHAAFVGPVAAAALLSPDRDHQRAAWEEAVRLGPSGVYYEDSLRLLSLLLASGNMPPPADRGTTPY